jgi:UDP-N-acetylglucosamine acyltransferase
VIHSTAIIDKNAELAPDVEVGPFSVIEAGARIGNGTRIGSHVVIQGNITIGENCTVSPFASLGGPPQDIGYKFEPTEVIIGKNNTIKEYVTVNRGTTKGGGVTKIGDNNFIMAYAHIAHDCQVGSSIIMANGATLAGHVEVSDFVIFSGLCAVHQFCRVGKYAFISGLTGIPKDVPPFVIAAGDRAKLYGLNLVGLERRNFSKDEITKLKRAYRILFRSALPLKTSLKIIRDELDGENITYLLDFIETSTRGICR